MDMDIIKPFINHDVEVLVAGVWIEGHMAPIVKGVIMLLPLPDQAAFYGPCALRPDVIQAIRQVKKSGVPLVNPVPSSNSHTTIRSSLDDLTAIERFRKQQERQGRDQK